MLPCHYRPYELILKEKVAEGSEFPIYKFRFALDNETQSTLGVSQPTTHIKIRAPDSCTFFKNVSLFFLSSSDLA